MQPSTAATESSNLTMESLSLPRELYWDGKTEPTSPYSELFSISESNGNWLCDDNFADGITLITDNVFELKGGIEFYDELTDGDDLVVELDDMEIVDVFGVKSELKTEHWNDKLHPAAQLQDYPIGAVITHPNHITKVQSPFDAGTFGSSNFDSAILTQLTPPHSPPQHGSPTAFQTAPIVTESNLNEPLSESPTQLHTNLSTPTSTPSSQNFTFSAWSGNSGADTLVSELNDDIARELQIVDEIVNNRAKELLDWNDECESLSSSCSAPSTDEEWIPGSSCSSAGSSPAHISSEEQLPHTAAHPKKRTRPYGRGVEDRKIRKKEQNKNAATRYRQKKKLEMEQVLTEDQKLSQRNEELKRVLADRVREAKYLKTLIREFYQNKKQKSV